MASEDQWVHEKDYGSGDVGGILMGTIEVIVGLFELMVWAWRNR